ncbi:apolipoprotein N-acyltransferase [Caenimonas terrae]|uniref:Apolipoprotein N-acyltransferase n=1 Tax=Caenimonas terrae TaxID=696074 RepID=A0ABW0NJL1_9BURK
MRGRAPFPFAIALLAGLAQAVSIAAPWNGQPQWWLQLLSVCALAWLLQREPPRRAFFLGWAFATAWLTATWWWLYISMHDYGGLPAVLTVVAVVGLAAFLSLYYAAAAGLAARSGGRWGAVVFAALWTLAELLRVTVFTGFPWGEGGYAHLGGPLAGYAPWIGVHGMTFVAAFIAAAVAALPRQRLGGVAAAACLALGLALPLAGAFSTSAGRVPVTLLQGDIPQDEKFEHGSGIPMALNWYGTQLRDATTPLVVAPETAIPLLPRQLPEGYLETVLQRYGRGTQAALLGIPLGNTKEGYTNSVMGVKPGAGAYRYDKHHLVPFGEFIPPMFRWFTEMMRIPLGDFNRGTVGQPSFDWAGQRFAPNICYEDLFGEELGRRFGNPTVAPTVFVNVSNIGWFGDTIAIDQHLQISRLRALEFERPMLRATNTGATVIIDHRGQVTHSLPRYTRGVLVGEVEGRNGITPYAWWVARAGLWPLWLLFGAIAALAMRQRRRAGPAT